MSFSSFISLSYLECPVSLLTGATSSGSSASLYNVNPFGTCHTKTFPSSEPEAIIESLKGFLGKSAPLPHPNVPTHQSVSNTGAVCPLNRGICSGSLPFSPTGITAKAPPPLASQLTARYSGFACPVSLVPPLQHSSYLHQIRVPRIATDMKIIIARFLPRRLAKDVSWKAISLRSYLLGGRRSLRYFDARTKRPAMAGCM